MGQRSEPARLCEGRWHADAPLPELTHHDRKAPVEPRRRSVADHARSLLLELASVLELIADAPHDHGARP